MRGEPQIEVVCDHCQSASEFLSLTALARGSYDERDVDRQLEGYGWQLLNGCDICPDCAGDIEDELAEPRK